MDSKEIEIIQKATEIFMQYGIKSVNMDDVARHLGISKKTLYKYVSDKKELVQKGMNMHCCAEDEFISAIEKQGLNAIDENFEIMKFLSSMLKTLHPSIMFDMEKYHPEIFKEMKESRKQMTYGVVKRNLEKGKQEGLYREDLDPTLIATLYINSIDTIFNFKNNSEMALSILDQYLEVFRYHIRGIASAKGVEYLIKKVNEQKNNN